MVAYEVGLSGQGIVDVDLRYGLSHSDPASGAIMPNTPARIPVSAETRVVFRIEVDPPVALPQDFFVAFRTSNAICGPIITCQQASRGSTAPYFYTFYDSPVRGWLLDELRDPPCHAGFDLVIRCAGAPDCNGNGLPDECDIADGTSPNCNKNELPDECEVGDVDGDGRVTVQDWPRVVACLTGPCGTSPCDPMLYENPCCRIVDAEADGDVDLSDVATLQTLSTGTP
jgi:hypothetical protein